MVFCDYSSDQRFGKLPPACSLGVSETPHAGEGVRRMREPALREAADRTAADIGVEEFPEPRLVQPALG